MLLRRLPRRPFTFVTPQDYNPKFKEGIEGQNHVRAKAPYRFAVIGCGPAGFYCAKNLIKYVDDIRVDIFDRFPHPYGLVRNGVAPDHQEMKNIQNDYAEVLEERGRCQFIGNVEIGKHISIAKLKELYSGVIYAYGATDSRMLGLPGEQELKGIYPSKRFVSWYNTSLDRMENRMELGDVKDVVIIGNGNVATDITRMLTKSYAELKASDMHDDVLDCVKGSAVRNIEIIGRRGICQAAFTTKEIREVSRIGKVKLYTFERDWKESLNESSKVEMTPGTSTEARAVARRTQFLKENTIKIQSEEQYQELKASD